ncbi:hypothetical protein TcCL_NonESM10357 [Trypanosoma cruzi]|nr:hypothetical protein TcCL_NonESM10357 [Trypanosoma cruzi]
MSSRESDGCSATVITCPIRRNMISESSRLEGSVVTPPIREMRATTRGSTGTPASILCSPSNGLCVSTVATLVGLDVSTARHALLPPPAPPLFAHHPSSCGSSE